MSCEPYQSHLLQIQSFLEKVEIKRGIPPFPKPYIAKRKDRRWFAKNYGQSSSLFYTRDEGRTLMST